MDSEYSQEFSRKPSRSLVLSTLHIAMNLAKLKVIRCKESQFGDKSPPSIFPPAEIKETTPYERVNAMIWELCEHFYCDDVLISKILSFNDNFTVQSEVTHIAITVILAL